MCALVRSRSVERLDISDHSRGEDHFSDFVASKEKLCFPDIVGQPWMGAERVQLCRKPYTHTRHVHLERDSAIWGGEGC
ncbi:hypothetical protein TNCV_5114541 [Trichonephila clavipes]|nr:hypothetical protein TNCV_5114541 [Trichonephila clavipes]